nr:MAG TPA: hypothetical protein [Caudoviricetes sp.]
MLPGKRPVVLLTWHKDRAFYFNYQKNFLLFSICGQKTVLLAPRKVIFGEFSF